MTILYSPNYATVDFYVWGRLYTFKIDDFSDNHQGIIDQLSAIGLDYAEHRVEEK